MDALIIGAVLIMSCVIIGITLSEMQRLNKECDDLHRALEKVEAQRDAENTRHKNLQNALRDRLEEVREALNAPNTIPNTKTVTISAENEELKPLHFVYCMRYDERKDLEEKYPTMGEGARRLKAQHVIMPQVMTEVEKRITESFDARRSETTYAVDIWVHK